VLVRVRAGSPNYRDHLRASAGVMGDGARGIAPFSDVERSARLNYSGRD